MGFYAPAQIVRDAKEHGVEVRPIDINASEWDCTLEPADLDQTHDAAGAGPATWGSGGPAVRLGMRLVKGLSEEHARAISTARPASRAFASIEEVRRRSAAPVAALRALARADAFRSLRLDRQQALWMLRAVRDEPMPLFDGLADVGASERACTLPKVPEPRQTAQDYTASGLSLKPHPVSFHREALNASRVSTCALLRDQKHFPHGASVRIAGIVLVRQRPGTASGIVFITLEDETGIANLIVRPRVYERFRRALGHAVLLYAEGRIERQGEVVHIVVARAASLDERSEALTVHSRDFH
jgi:error-prone DNA polymerase